MPIPGAHHLFSPWHTQQLGGPPLKRVCRWVPREECIHQVSRATRSLPPGRGALSTQAPLDPLGRVNCLRAGEQREGDIERKTSKALRKPRAHPSPTTYDQTDSRDRLAAQSSPVQSSGTSPTALRSLCRSPALGSNHLAPGRAPQPATQSL